MLHYDNGDSSRFHGYVSKDFFSHNSILYEELLGYVSDMDHMLLYELHILDNDFGIQSPNAQDRNYSLFCYTNCCNCITFRIHDAIYVFLQILRFWIGISTLYLRSFILKKYNKLMDVNNRGSVTIVLFSATNCIRNLRQIVDSCVISFCPLTTQI